MGTRTLIIVLVLAALPYVNYWIGGFSRLVLTEQHEEKTFWVRNKDHLWLVIIGGIIGFVIGYIPTLIRWIASVF